MYAYTSVASTAVLEFLRPVYSDTDVYVHVCDVYVHVCDVCVQVQSVQMEVYISLLRKGCVRGGTSTLDLDQYATKVY